MNFLEGDGDGGGGRGMAAAEVAAGGRRSLSHYLAQDIDALALFSYRPRPPYGTQVGTNFDIPCTGPTSPA